MRASITCRGAGIRKLLIWAGLFWGSAHALGCRAPDERTLSSSLGLHVLPDCAPARVDRIVIEPLGDFAPETQALVSVALGDKPVRLSDLPAAAQRFRLSVETDDFRGGSLAQAAEADERFEVLLLPYAQSCRVIDRSLPSLSAGALVSGDALLLAGGAFEASSDAWLLRTAEPEWVPLKDGQGLITRRAGASAVSVGDEVWILGGVTDTRDGSRALPNFERFDAASGGFSGLTGRLREPRFAGSAVRLLDGRVLLAGGRAEVGGEPLRSLETLSDDGKQSTTWDSALPFGAAVLSLHVRDDGKVVALSRAGAEAVRIALLDPVQRAAIELDEPPWAPEVDVSAGVALPGGRFASFELARASQTAPWTTTGRVFLLLEGERFVVLSDWLGDFAGLSEIHALALADGRILLAGRREAQPALRVLDLGNREVQSRALDLAVDALFMRDDGSVLMLGASGARVLREDALSAFDNPGGTVTADDSKVLALDAYGRFEREGLGLRATVRGARFDLSPLRYRDVRIDVQVEGEAELLLRRSDGQERSISVGNTKLGPAFCQLAFSGSEPLSIVRREERITLRAGRGARSCQLEGITGPVAIGLRASEANTLVRELRLTRL